MHSLPPGSRPGADLGCGTGRITAYLDSLGVEAFGIDLSPAMVNLARLTHPDLRFNVGSITDLDLSDAAAGGVLAWYSTIHTPPQDLPSVFAEFSRVLTPGGYLLVGFRVGDEGPPRMVVFRDGVSVDAYDVTPERVADLCRQAGLVVHAQLLRAAQGRKCAHKPASSPPNPSNIDPSNAPLCRPSSGRCSVPKHPATRLQRCPTRACSGMLPMGTIGRI